jgi:hypothetical protein
VLHPSRASVPKEELKEKLAKTYKVADSKCIFLWGFKIAFGGQRSTGEHPSPDLPILWAQEPGCMSLASVGFEVLGLQHQGRIVAQPQGRSYSVTEMSRVATVLTVITSGGSQHLCATEGEALISQSKRSDD